MTIEVNKKYTKKEFRQDLFNIMFIAGTMKKQIMFLLSDKDLIIDS